MGALVVRRLGPRVYVLVAQGRCNCRIDGALMSSLPEGDPLDGARVDRPRSLPTRPMDQKTCGFPGETRHHSALRRGASDTSAYDAVRYVEVRCPDRHHRDDRATCRK